jgi:cytochrome c oxidase cbb3-type subunit III
MLPIRKLLPSLLVTSLLLALCVPFSLAQQKSRPKHSNKMNAAAGRDTYNTSCAGCHGLDGHGSDKAINIAAGTKAHHLSDAQLSGVISHGVPGTGMPAFRNLNENQIRALVVYLRALQGKVEARSLPGDAKRGKEIFFGKGECSSCHTISGQGGFVGPDLSAYGSMASAEAIHEEIVKSQRTPRSGYRSAVLTTSNGERIEGMIRNEDNFSVQFQTKDGSFHFFQKSELRDFSRAESSLMPTDYAERLSARDLEDLVNFLITASPESSNPPTSRKKEYEDE